MRPEHRFALWVVAITVCVVASVVAVNARRARSCTPHFDENYIFRAAHEPVIGRMFVIPGMDGSAKNVLAIPTFRSWLDQLNQQGIETVVLNTPIPKACWFADGGGYYRSAFLHELDDVVADADAKHGHVARSMITGVSYGGVHALVGYAARPGLFVGWQAAMSVTKLDALAELRDVGEVADFDPFNEVAWLRTGTGYLTWGGRDMRVDHWLDQRLYGLVQSSGVIGKGYSSLTHETNAHTVADLIADARRQLGAGR